MTSEGTKPLVSVVIPSYNHERFIGEAIDSVLNSTFTNLELVVVDDGSQDSSVKVINSFSDSRVRLVCQENAGAHRAMNRGAALAQAPFLAFLNSDDRFQPGKLEQHLALHEQNDGIEASVARIRHIDEEGAPLDEDHWAKRWYAGALEIFQEEPSLHHSLMVINHLVTSSVLFVKRDVFMEIGGFIELRYTHDWQMFLTLASRRRFTVIEQPLTDYRIHGANTIAEDTLRVDVEANFLVARHLYQQYQDRNPRVSPSEAVRYVSKNPRLSPRLLLLFDYVLRTQGVDLGNAITTLLGDDHPVMQLGKQMVREDRDYGQAVTSLQERLSREEAALIDTRRLLAQKEAQLESVVGSYSWKLTVPLRWTLDHLRTLKAKTFWRKATPAAVLSRRIALSALPETRGDFPLAVLARFYGASSETFIRRHMYDLLPEKTLIIAMEENKPFGWPQRAQGPVLILDRLPAGSDSFAAVAEMLRRCNVRVVLGEFLDIAWSWIDTARKAGVRLFGHAHGIDVSRYLRNLDWQERYRKYNETSGIITMSRLSKSRLIQIGIAEDKIHVIPYGVDVPVSPVHRPDRKAVTCLAVGRFVPKKAPLNTLEAFRIACEQNPLLNLVYVGDGPLLKRAHTYVEEYHISDKVEFTGVIPNTEVRELMIRSDIFVQHSIIDPETGDEEGLPVAILEAMASAIPVVATKHAGIPEAVVDGSTGFLVDEGDTTAMASRILELSRSSGYRRSLGIEGWREASARFSWKKEKQELLKVLGL